MAETFNTADLAITSSETLLYTAPASTGNVAICLSLRITNIDGTDNDVITATIYESDGSTKKSEIAHTISVPADTSLELAGSSKLVLKAGEQIKVAGGNASGDLEAYLSVLEIT